MTIKRLIIFLFIFILCACVKEEETITYYSQAITPTPQISQSPSITIDPTVETTFGASNSYQEIDGYYYNKIDESNYLYLGIEDNSIFCTYGNLQDASKYLQGSISYIENNTYTITSENGSGNYKITLDEPYLNFEYLDGDSLFLSEDFTFYREYSLVSYLGKWQSDEVNIEDINDSFSLIFNEDNTGTLIKTSHEINFEYTVENNQINLFYENGTNASYYAINYDLNYLYLEYIEGEAIFIENEAYLLSLNK